MGENTKSALFARKLPGKKLYAFYNQNRSEDDTISGVQISCKAISKMKLPKEVKEAIRTVKKKPYSLNENAERLSKALGSSDPEKGQLEELTRKAYIRNVEDFHALRSFAWTMGDYQKRIGAEFENLSEKELIAIAETVIEDGYLNYRGGSYFPGLCSRPDVNVYYVPEGIDKEAKDKISSLGTTASLNRMRKDLLRFKPIAENIAMAIFSGSAPEAMTTFFSKVLSAWCALAIAAKEPFCMTEGPKNYRLRKKEIAEPVSQTLIAAEEPKEEVEPKNSEESFFVAEIDGELVRIDHTEVDKEETYEMLSQNGIPKAVLADAKTILPKLTEFGEIDIQYISKRLTEIEEDSMANNNERSVEELIAELMGNAQKKSTEPAPAPTPVEPEWEVTTNKGDDIDAGWEVTPATKPAAPSPVIPEPQYVAPEPAPVIPDPNYVIPEPQYIPPEPQYVAPEPAPVIPDPNYVIPEPQYIPPEPQYVASEPSPVIPDPNYVIPEPQYIPPEPVDVIPEPAPAPVIPEIEYVAPVVPELEYVAPEPAPVVVEPEPEPVVEEPAPAVAEPEPEPVPEPAPAPKVSSIPDIAPAGVKPAETSFQTNQATEEEIDEHEAAVRKRMREILEQNKKKQQEKDEVRRQMEERRLEVARKQEQRRQEILAKRKADYQRLLDEEESLKKIVEENKNALMGDRKRKRMESQKRIDEIEDIIMKEYLDLKRGTNDYHTGLTQELY